MQTSPIPQIRVEQVSFAPASWIDRQRRAASATIETRCLLENISLEVFQGDRIGVVGPSGAGKTMLLRLLNRLGEPTRGQIYFNGTALSQISIVQLRQQIVLVLQEAKLLGMTVQQALAYPLMLRQLPPQTIQSRISEWCDRLHLPADWLPRTEVQLSVGQRQLVSLVRALVTQPAVLLLDEPTASLDVGRSDLILNVLIDLADTHGTTIFMVSHQLDFVQAFCTRLLYVEQGRVHQDCPSATVNWSDLRQKLVQVEAQQASDWT